MKLKFDFSALGRRSAALLAIAAHALLLLGGTTASAQDGNQLQDIQVQSLPGNRVELTFVMTDLAPEPLAFTIENPARIALDLPNTGLGMDSRRRDVNLGPVDTVLTAEAGGRTRVVLNLDTMVGYETRRSGNTLVVTVGGDDSYDAGSTQFAGSQSAAPVMTAAASGPR